MIAICLTCSWLPVVAGSTPLPNLGVIEIRLGSTQAAGPTPVLPSVNENYYVNVGVANFGNWQAKNFTLDVRMEWSGNQTPSLFSYHFNGLAAGDASYAPDWGPFVAHSPSNLTVTTTINSNQTVAGTNSDNTLTSTFAIGNLFPNVQEIQALSVWNETQLQTFHYFDPYATPGLSGIYANKLYVMTSGAGDIIAYSSDAGEIKVYRKGTPILDLPIGTGKFPAASLSPSGKFIAVSTSMDVSVYDTGHLNGTDMTQPIFVVEKTTLNLTSISLVAVSDSGLLAVAGSQDLGNSLPGGFSENALTVINVNTSKVLWAKNLDGFLGLGPDITSRATSLGFDGADELLVGEFWVSSSLGFKQAVLYESHPWLSLIDSTGKVVWDKYLTTDVTWAFISHNGESISAATENGRVNFYQRTSNNTFSLYVGYNVNQNAKAWSSYIPIAVSPEGDIIAVADRANVYLVDTSGSPLFRINIANAASLALGGGQIEIGETGGAVAISLWGPVDAQISAAQNAIANAKGRGADVSNAQTFLAQATTARASLHWYKAYSAATKSLMSATQAPAVTASTSEITMLTGTSPMSTASPGSSFVDQTVGIAVAVLAIIGITVLLKRKKR